MILGTTPERDSDFWESAGRLSLVEGQQLGSQIILFKKIEDEDIDQEIARLETAGNSVNAAKGDAETVNISYDLFKKIDLRIAEIITAERVAKTEKLMRLKIKLGSEQRQIIAGIASYYKPDDLIGRKIVLVANLEPAKIRGEISQGMLLAAKDGEKLTLLTISDEINSGAKVS